MTTKTLNPHLPSKLIHQFPHPTWIENLAIRSDGSILCTLLTTPDLYLVSPSKSHPPLLIHTFAPAAALTGIVESKLTPEIFYLAAGDFNALTNTNTPGSYSVWSIDLRSYTTHNASISVSKIVDIAESGLLNGMEIFFNSSKNSESILIADSEVGCVWKVDPVSGNYAQLLALEEMRYPAGGIPIGINGIKIHDGFLYWTNTALAIFCRVEVDAECDAPVGEAELLVRGLLVDDFCFDGVGDAWVAQNVLNTVAVVKIGAGWDVQREEDGKEIVVVCGEKGELTVAGGTACQFGRGEGDGDVLYLVTSGGLAAPVDGVKTEGGKVVGIETRGFVG